MLFEVLHVTQQKNWPKQPYQYKQHNPSGNYQSGNPMFGISVVFHHSSLIVKVYFGGSPICVSVGHAVIITDRWSVGGGRAKSATHSL